ncbi:uncharacterized protein LOC113890286 [Bos indicus x Bos taurus]|uniref:uncharacterized protein LOC113890286 n=1 Tax=Bos indicus x Bos taurus TaxID=30522 RepID=UPI000F7D3A97|nr:uncharacterized protein LOC113890286 [Bos indicus x Bos taurus]XP_027394024.1 uncharacterized protein LOC113890286 [Bos indicus x Bos taurus]XP_027394025.1 uncharacterized protein LOC113890286 [Bos indicus x Bos taurus]
MLHTRPGVNVCPWDDRSKATSAPRHCSCPGWNLRTALPLRLIRGAVGASVPVLRQVMFCPGAQPQNRGGSSAPEPWGKLSPRTVGEAQPQNRGGSSAPEPWRELSPRTVEGAQPQNRGGSSAPEPWRELSPRTVGEAQPQNRGGSSAPEPWGELSPRTVGGAQPQNRGGSSAPEPWGKLSPRTVGVPVYHFHTKGRMPLAGVMLRACPSDTCVEALPPAPLSRPAFGGKVFEQPPEWANATVTPDLTPDIRSELQAEATRLTCLWGR